MESMPRLKLRQVSPNRSKSELPSKIIEKSMLRRESFYLKSRNEINKSERVIKSLEKSIGVLGNDRYCS